MEFQVDGWNNFCRVFELPECFPEEFCFNGGIQVNFKMIDWFNPVPGISGMGIDKIEYIARFGMNFQSKTVTTKELREILIPFLQKKLYYRKERRYLIIFDFGEAIYF